jgi:hypothetical protein
LLVDFVDQAEARWLSMILIDKIYVSEILQLTEIAVLLLASFFCHTHGIMGCWNNGILGLKAEKINFHFQKFL